MNRPVRAVVFDLDGTLVDSMPLVLRAYAHAVRPYLPTVTPDELKSRMGGPPHRILGGLLSDPREAAHALQRLAEFGAGNWGLIQPFDGMLEMLAKVQSLGVKTALWTGRERQSTEIILGKNRITEKLDTCVCGDDMPSHKPDPAGLAEALRRVGAAPADAIFVGDADVDVQAGAQLGVRTLLISHGYTVSAELISQAWMVVKTPAEAYERLHDAISRCTKTGGTSELS